MPSPVAESGSLLPVALIAHVVKVVHVPDAMTAVGAFLLAGSVIVTVWVVEADLPHTSVTVRVTWYEPGVEYVRDGFADVLVPVSPKAHAYLMASPWLSTVPVLLNVQVVNDAQL